METNWFVISIVVFFGIILVFILIRQNKKDEKKLKKKLNYSEKSEEIEIGYANKNWRKS
ncbi:hypothetical protein IRZ71_21710 [Flavobacterium sp. ANB]|uniref:hypothetical protein n=1 Tax=Flavobacterium sp. ANB TaxID=2783790 RepID=UPI00188D2EC9|nr:hypothetical protein [Flavobacterium sp. ANB]MBF4518982.1 hypothetical protein [Flavobacterium sp. ANB]